MFPLASWMMGLPQLPLRLLVTGGSGSGKTAILKKLKAAWARLGVVIYDCDPADESVDFYKDKAPGVPVRAVSMKYADGVGIHLAPRLATEAGRQMYAHKIIPDIKGDQSPFWTEAPRLKLENICRTLHVLAPGKFLQAHVNQVADNRLLHSALSEAAGLGDPYGNYGDNDSKRDVHVSLVTKLKPLRLFAACDMRCTERIDVPVTRGVLVLEWTDKFSKALSGMFSFLLDTCAEEYLSEQRLVPPIAFVVDEFRQYQQLDFIENVARRGRKSAVSIVLTMHEITGLYDRYTKDRAEEICGLLDYKLFLKTGSPTTAAWASSHTGTTECLEEIAPRSTDGSAKAYSRRVTMRPNVLPDEFRRLKAADYGKDTIEGYADFPDETRPFTCSFRDEVTLSKPPAARPLRPDGDQILPPMDEATLVALGITPTPHIREALR